MAVSANHAKAKWFIDNLSSLSHEQIAEAMEYKWFRLCTLYRIKDKDGNDMPFKPNAEQEDYYINQHGRDIILKARQLGFTTFAMIDALDECLFTKNYSAGCICHNLEDAKDIFRNKIKYAYQSITDEQRLIISELGYELPTPINDKDNGYVFSNGSSIKVSVSYRGGTLQSLHVSEFGKICRKFPDKAKEIVTGAFEAVGVGNRITIESTAEGRDGYFYDYCNTAKKLKESGKKPGDLDFNFHFFPWFLRAEYSIDGGIDSSLEEYFEKLLVNEGIELSDGQKAWYSAKYGVLGEDMQREYPSTPEEAFAQAIDGAYYAKQMIQARKDGRIGKLPDNSHLKVNTAWDLGVGDSTTIWFYRKVGNEIHVIDYYENSGEGLEHYAKVLKDKNYNYGIHYAPHDIDNREWAHGGKSRKDIAAQGYEIDGALYRIFFSVVPKGSIDTGIEAVRRILPRCVFDESNCELGIKWLEEYRKDWNDQLGTWRDHPRHDKASHGADAFRYLAVAEEGSRIEVAAPEIRMW